MSVRQLIYLVSFLTISSFLFAQDKMTVKNTGGKILMEVNDEGNYGSIQLLPTATAPTAVTNKIYNFNGKLYFNGNELSTAAAGGGDFSNGGDTGGADRTLGNKDNYDLGFLTNNQTRLFIQNDGNVGIGIGSPGSTLDVKGTLRLSGASSGYVGLAPASDAGSTTYTLPASDGSNGQILSTNGSGTLNWQTVAAGGGDFSNGGDTGGADRTLGNKDQYDLGFMVDNFKYMVIRQNGEIDIGPDGLSTSLNLYGDIALYGTVDGAVSFSAPVDGGYTTYTLPGYDGSNGQFLSTNGKAELSWQTAAAGGGDFSNGGDTGGADRTLGNKDNYDLGFITNNQTRLVIQNDGNIGIGTDTPGAALEVAGQVKITGGFPGDHRILTSDANGLASWESLGWFPDLFLRGGDTGGADRTLGNTDNYDLGFLTNNQTRLHIQNDGNIGIGITDPDHPLHMVSGAHVTSGGVWTNASSREYKQNIRDLSIEEALSALQDLKPTKYNYKVDLEEESLGFIAEDVPDLVATKDRKGLSPMDIVAVLTKVVQQQQKKIEDLEKTIQKFQ
jgi:hypothetical protein